VHEILQKLLPLEKNRPRKVAMGIIYAAYIVGLMVLIKLKAKK
jgi:hypothetical protein